MKKINTSILLNFINQATINVIAEIDTNDYLKKERLGGHIFYEKQHELDTIKELKTPSEENPNFFNYSFYFINDLFLNN